MRDKPTTVLIVITPEEHATLTSWQRTTTMPAGLQRRGQIILLLGQGVPMTQIAVRVGMTRRHIYKWMRRWQAAGLAGLHSAPCGRPRRSA
jgi:hypothetical protein